MSKNDISIFDTNKFAVYGIYNHDFKERHDIIAVVNKKLLNKNDSKPSLLMFKFEFRKLPEVLFCENLICKLNMVDFHLNNEIRT